MSKHTPGPWRLTDRRPVTGNWASRIPFAIEKEVARVVGVAPLADVCDQPNAEANARLIAAAPDLLDALKRLLNDNLACASVAQGIEQARAAIAKAEGK